MNPKDIARLISEDPDILSEGYCEACGGSDDDPFRDPTARGFGGKILRGHRYNCPTGAPMGSKIVKPQSPPPPEIYKPEFSLLWEEEGHWLLGMEYDEGLPRVSWALRKEDGKFFDGDEWDAWTGGHADFINNLYTGKASHRNHWPDDGEVIDEDGNILKHGWWEHHPTLKQLWAKWYGVAEE
jgi:hypothetical protein